MRTFLVHALRVGLQHVGCHVARNFKDSLVVFDGILVVDGGIGIVFFVGIVAFFQLNDALHQGIVQIESNLRVVGIIIGHDCLS